jgi:hypothetical protein
MTCEQVLDIVDSDGLVDIAPRRVDAARAHAVTCVGCRAAFETALGLPTRLGALEQPALPRDLDGAILRRVGVTAAERRPESMEAPRPVRLPKGRAQWVAAGGLAASLALAVYAGLAAGWPAGRLAVGVGLQAGFFGVPHLPSSLVVVALSLILAVSALLAPRFDHRREH